MQHTNIIAIKDVIILEKVKKKMLLEGSVDTTTPAKMGQALSPIDLVWRYRWAMSNIHMDAAKKQGLTGVKKYWRRVSQDEMQLD